jgi:hypothetical protein
MEFSLEPNVVLDLHSEARYPAGTDARSDLAAELCSAATGKPDLIGSPWRGLSGTTPVPDKPIGVLLGG